MGGVRKRPGGTPLPGMAVVPVPADAKPPTPAQRAKTLTDAYYDREPMCNWPAVRGVVAKAIKVARWSDGQIRLALLALADEGRPVTTNSLRLALDGPPRRQGTTTQRVNAALALAAKHDAEDAARLARPLRAVGS